MLKIQSSRGSKEQRGCAGCRLRLSENKTGQNKWKVAARFCFRKLGSQGKLLISANALGFDDNALENAGCLRRVM